MKSLFLNLIFFNICILRSLKNAMGDRYEKLKQELNQAKRNLILNSSIANKVIFFFNLLFYYNLFLRYVKN